MWINIAWFGLALVHMPPDIFTVVGGSSDQGQNSRGEFVLLCTGSGQVLIGLEGIVLWGEIYH